MVSSSSRKELRARLQTLQNKPENLCCGDCSDKKPSWASIISPPAGTTQAVGLICCYQCSLAHKKLGSRVCTIRNIGHGQWPVSDVELMELGGNKTANSIFEGKMSFDTPRPNSSSHPAVREVFVQAKYADLEFFNPSALKLLQRRTKPITLSLRAPSSDTRKINTTSATTTTHNSNDDEDEDEEMTRQAMGDGDDQQDNSNGNTGGASRRREARRASMPLMMVPQTASPPSPLPSKSPGKPKSSKGFGTSSRSNDGFGTIDDGFVGITAASSDDSFGGGGDTWWKPTEDDTTTAPLSGGGNAGRRKPSSTRGGLMGSSNYERRAPNRTKSLDGASPYGGTKRGISFRRKKGDSLAASSHSRDSKGSHNSSDRERLGNGDEDDPSNLPRPRRQGRRSSLGYSQPPASDSSAVSVSSRRLGESSSRKSRNKGDSLGCSSNHSVSFDDEPMVNSADADFSKDAPPKPRSRRSGRRGSIGASTIPTSSSDKREAVGYDDAAPNSEEQKPRSSRRVGRRGSVSVTSSSVDGRRRHKDVVGSSSRSGMSVDDDSVVEKPNSTKDKPIRQKSSRLLGALYGDNSGAPSATPTEAPVTTPRQQASRRSSCM